MKKVEIKKLARIEAPAGEYENITTFQMVEEKRPTCAVQGMVRPGAMCGKVIVGMKYCGYSGTCPHKQDPAQSDAD